MSSESQCLIIMDVNFTFKLNFVKISMQDSYVSFGNREIFSEKKYIVIKEKSSTWVGGTVQRATQSLHKHIDACWVEGRECPNIKQFLIFKTFGGIWVNITPIEIEKES